MSYNSPSEYPAHTYQPKKKSRKALWITLAIFGVVLLVCGGGVAVLAGLGKAADTAVKEIDKEIAAQADVKKKDVKILTCKESQFGGFEVEFEVKNSSAAEQSYWIQIDLYDSTGKVRRGEAHGAINNLGAGATAKEKTTGNGDMKKGDKCVLGGVS